MTHCSFNLHFLNQATTSEVKGSWKKLFLCDSMYSYLHLSASGHISHLFAKQQIHVKKRSKASCVLLNQWRNQFGIPLFIHYHLCWPVQGVDIQGLAKQSNSCTLQSVWGAKLEPSSAAETVQL